MCAIVKTTGFSADIIMVQADFFSKKLKAHREEGRFRTLRPLSTLGGHAEYEGERFLNFSSNDYLGLASDDGLIEAAQTATELFGCGATASRLMAGNLLLHEELEERLAELTGHEAALVFPTGFQANLGAITALVGRSDVVFSDQLNHASIIDACRLAGAQVFVYDHGNVDHLEAMLKAVVTSGTKIIVTDSLFSMDGDIAPLAQLAVLAQRHGTLLVVDEAHAIGVHGDGGGICKDRGIQPDVVVGTLSKSLGSAGGFVAGLKEFRDLVINEARPFIFSTGLAPSCAASAITATDYIMSDPSMGEELLARSARFRNLLREGGFEISDDDSQIVPIIIGDNDAAVAFSDRLADSGVLAMAVRPPTVPLGTARIRLSLTLAHTDEDLERAAQILIACGLETGVLRPVTK